MGKLEYEYLVELGPDRRISLALGKYSEKVFWKKLRWKRFDEEL
jgi:hypothetical protein